MSFELSAQNIKDGFLRDDDFSAAAGFPIKSFELSDFPHFEQLRISGYLPRPKEAERSEAIREALDGAGILKPSGPFAPETADDVSGLRSPAVYATSEPVILSKSDITAHFELLKTQGFGAARGLGSPLWHSVSFSTGSSERDVLPGVMNEDIEVGEAFRRNAAFILRFQTKSPEEFWALKTKIPSSLIDNAPAAASFLVDDLHERRHLHQIILDTRSPAPKFYAELDADTDARALLRQANLGQEACAADLHGRYIDMLRSKPEYWFAAKLERLEAQKDSDDYFETFREIREIRTRLALLHGSVSYEGTRQDCGDGRGGLHISSAQLQNAIGQREYHRGFEGAKAEDLNLIDNAKVSYWCLSGSPSSTDPAFFYTGLRQLIEHKAFTDHKVESLAVRIMEAGQYFNEDLAYGDQAPARARLNARLQDLVL